MMNDPIVLTVTGTVIAGLFSALWYFVQKFIRRTEKNNQQLVDTLENLNKTMNEINTNLIVFRTSATGEFNQIHESIDEIKEITANHARSIEHLAETVKVIQVHHSRNHPDDKI